MENKHEKMTEEEFIKETSSFKNTSELYLFIFLLNTLNGWMQEFLFILQDTNDF